MKLISLFIFLFCFHTVLGLMSGRHIDYEILRADMIAKIVNVNFKKNGWTTVLCIGNLPDELYKNMQEHTVQNTHSIAVTNIENEGKNFNTVPYYANTVIIDLQEIKHYEATIFKLRNSPYWHPHANVVIYFHQRDHENLPKIFFSLWYFKAINAIIVQYDDNKEYLLISQYSPYISEDYKLEYTYGCWTTREIGRFSSGFEEDFTCEVNCHNVSLNSKLRSNNLGTCIGFNKLVVPYENASEILTTMNLFQDKSINLHGFKFRAYATEIKPFLLVGENSNGSNVLHSRQGLLWNSIAKLMNFEISLISNVTVMKMPFNYELIMSKIFEFAARKIDLCLIPTYLFDPRIVKLDFSIPYSDSGVCIITHRAGYERQLFIVKSFRASCSFITNFVLCFICIWITFSIYHYVVKGHISLDQIGKDLLNTFRTVLSITPHNPPRHRFFRPFLTFSMWGFFAFNFASQASITSFLAAVKRGKEVDTFREIVDKGYRIHGIASPDIFVPDSDEIIRKITSKIIHIKDPFKCVESIRHDKHRFCLIDCNVGRYLERNTLNEKGEQYLHIARDRMHSHYLIAMLMKHSPLTKRVNKYIRAFYEAGLIKKWEQYRYNVVKEEAVTKPLGIDDYQTIFKVYCYSLGFTVVIFLLEWLIYHLYGFVNMFFYKIN